MPLIGEQFTAPELTDQSPEVQQTDAGTNVTRIYHIKKTDIKSQLDALTYGTADVEFAGSFLREAGVSVVSAEVVELRLSYRPTEPIEDVPEEGTITLSCDANPLEIPIGQHPNVNTISPGSKNYDPERGIGLKPPISGEDWTGITAYLDPQPTFTREEVLGTFVFSEANIVNAVGKRNPPNGVTTPTADAWLKVGFTVQQRGDKFVQSETWQYARNGWVTDIYEASP